LNPDLDPRHITCIVDAMRAAGVDASAIQFFTESHLLLSDFHTHGHIDVGYAVAPWVEHGAPQAVFLNGDPTAVCIFSLDRTLYEGFPTATAYADLKAALPECCSMDRILA
jgi:hypothetical protein